ncbi:uncharacterized protein Z520_00565 [Fonsecaea multimorphosa CBS 102226]|uniref:Uncharacterized protein n=1 Tax=Fonsecaea multimorphosa CBS 102226 TaxID=1442371 RepID=A0A0D2L482_9EURO|nr:uncharacterized protein Z520_00565 [Fonsecaea multimorphosa CBS 102226]KIY03874.1 hypothetical protein Z520_00565 [Fonsecaea multimorphosa CBS 102226]
MATRLYWTILWTILLDKKNCFFLFLFVFRYLRFAVHLVSYFLYRPSPIPRSPSLTERDCTVVIPTCDPEDPAFSRCVESVVRAFPAVIHIVVVGKEQEKQVWSTILPYVTGFPSVCFRVSSSVQANKRHQIAVALPAVSTAITVLCDDHVIWPSATILRAAVAPFEEDDRVGGVGTTKRVIRHPHKGLWAGFWNVMGALYLERHNFEHTASNAVDGGVAVISGRTCLYRTHILQDLALLAGYLDERFLFGLCGPLNADDDNFLTRHLVRQGWKIKFQNTPEALILCDVGEYPKFLSQCLRWARTTFRSNCCSLVTDRSVYGAQPWAVYSLQLSLMVNFALFYDAALVWTLIQAPYLYTPTTLKTLVAWILLSKLPKLAPYFLRHPADLLYLPAYYVFAYFHSLIKLWALLTFWDTQWSGRNLDGINRAAAAAAAAGEDGADADDGEGKDGGEGGGGGGKDHLQGSDSRSLARENPEDYYSAHDSSLRHASASRGIAKTPWGTVRAQNLHQVPANVLQTQLGGSKRTKRAWTTGPTTTKQPPDYNAVHQENGIAPEVFHAAYSRRWTRRGECLRLHDGDACPPPLSPATTPAIPVPSEVDSTVSSVKAETYSRSWTRRGGCNKLHDEGYHLRRGTCVLRPCEQ